MSLPDSGARKSFGEGMAIREADPHKSAVEGISPFAIFRLGKRFSDGDVKYGDFRNWEKGMLVTRYVGAIIRHAFQYLARDGSEDHLAAIMWNAQCLIHHEEVGGTSGKTFDELDDRPRWKREDASAPSKCDCTANAIGPACAARGATTPRADRGPVVGTFTSGAPAGGTATALFKPACPARAFGPANFMSTDKQAPHQWGPCVNNGEDGHRWHTDGRGHTWSDVGDFVTHESAPIEGTLPIAPERAWRDVDMVPIRPDEPMSVNYARWQAGKVNP